MLNNGPRLTSGRRGDGRDVCAWQNRSWAVERYIVAGEIDQSHLFGGRSVFGWEPPPEDRKIAARAPA